MTNPTDRTHFVYAAAVGTTLYTLLSPNMDPRIAAIISVTSAAVTSQVNDQQLVREGLSVLLGKIAVNQLPKDASTAESWAVGVLGTVASYVTIGILEDRSCVGYNL